MSSLVLYNYFRSSTSYRARIALHHKGLNFEYRAINLLKGEQRSPEYLKINPLGGIPTLIHEGNVIPESVAIIEYLEEVFPQNPLLPKDAYLKARVRQTSEVINSFMHPMANLRLMSYMEKKHGYDQNAKNEWSNHWLNMGLETLETTLSQFSGKYSFGDDVTVTDLLLIPQLLTSQRFGVDTSPYKTLTKINGNCQKLEAFQKAHPFIQIDTPEELRKK